MGFKRTFHFTNYHNVTVLSFIHVKFFSDRKLDHYGPLQIILSM